MLSLRAHTAAAAVLSYYNQLGEYYMNSEAAQRGGGAVWLGSGAERLGLKGGVERGDFARLLEGKLPDGTQLGTYRGGQLEHRPSWDLTFSAPKSVSLMALVGGDSRLVAAHDQAVRAALAYVESRVAETRIRQNGEVHREATGNLLIASLREGTSRANDPQLHTHNVVINATQSADGQWRSLDGHTFFQAQKEIGQIYRNELALRCQALGYQINQGKDGVFELAGVPQAVIDAFSTRSAQIEDALAAKGLTRDSASSAQKDVATLDTRAKKTERSPEELRDAWCARATELGFDAHAQVDRAQRNTTASPEAYLGRNDASATIAVESAIARLAEREAAFSARALRLEALQIAVGRARLADIEGALAKAESREQLIPRTLYLDGRSLPGYTTLAGMETERRMLAAECAGRGNVGPLLTMEAAYSAVAKAEFRSGPPWTNGQRTATAALLSSSHQIEGVQGYAGTAKTTTVIRTVVEEAQRQGRDIVAMAPTASAAATLGDAIGKPAVTVARHLSQLDGADRARSGALWMVDEASLLSARQMTTLLEGARDQGARVVLIGDVQQLGSVEAGAAFRQLQESGMRTAVLDEIVRQDQPAALASVYAAIRGDARAALAAIDRGGGRVVELPELMDRLTAIARDYAALAPADQQRTLVLDPSREGREQLSAVIREHLKRDGTLSGPALRVDTLEDKRLTREEARHVQSYAIGDRVTFRADYANGIAKGVYYRVAAIDQPNGSLRLEGTGGNAIVWAPAKSGSSQVQAYGVTVREVMAGDRISWTRNDPTCHRVNGHGATVVAVQDNGTIRVRDQRGTQTIDPSDSRHQHFRHAYVSTVHAAQGRTADRVLVNAESFRTNLLSQKSFYVAISRARSDIRLYTDDRKELIRNIEERTGEKATALLRDDRSMAVHGVSRGVEAAQGGRGYEASKSSGRDGGLSR